MNNEFQWDDKSIEEMLVKAFSERLFVGSYKTPKTIIEEFKASHTEVKRDWSIESLKDSWDGKVYPFTSMPDKRFSIHSVKRLSDGVVFNVGDEVDSYWGRQIITRLFIRDNDIIVEFATYRSPLSGLSKPLQRTPLLTTCDGVDIYEGDLFCAVQANTFDILTECRHKLTNPTMWTTFSTKEAAQQFVLMNKPCLSVNDAIGLWAKDGYFPMKAKELAKQRLDKQ